MDYLFPVSGVETNILIPPLVALGISFFTSMGGVSGAFLLLPFQMSVLDYTSPSVSATNFVYNIVAIPSGVYRYILEGRMAWPLTWVVIAGTLPGVFLGYFIRMRYLPDPRGFKLFVGIVLLYLGGRLIWGMITGRGASGGWTRSPERKVGGGAATPGKQAAASGAGASGRVAPPGSTTAPGKQVIPGSALSGDAAVRTISVSLSHVKYEFWGETFTFSTPGMFTLALVVGLIGGIYGIGGGAIIAPFCVAVFRLPVYTVAGAALMGTFLTSIAGVAFYSLIPAADDVNKSPDWLLGLLFGAGGFVGMYLGARCQKYVPQTLIKLMLGAIILFVAVSYIVQFF